jgi:hypothetical protein
VNRRTLKKICRRAMETLIRDHRYDPGDFKPADGSETIYAPPGMERQYVDHHWLRDGPLKGTPLLWVRTSYEYDEWDARLPFEVLCDVEFWSTFEPTAAELAELNGTRT